MGKYNVNEGNQIGYMPTEFGEDGKLIETKLVAGGDLKAGQVVELTASMTVNATSAASAKVLGVAMFDVKSGEPVAVECEGLFKLTAGAAITAGDLIFFFYRSKLLPDALVFQKEYIDIQCL